MSAQAKRVLVCGSRGPLNAVICDCQSSNRPKETGLLPEIVLDHARYFADTAKPRVAVDACIAPVIERLWRAGIRTRGCCCGHNGLFGGANVALHDPADVPRAAEILKADGRDWRIFADVNVTPGHRP